MDEPISFLVLNYNGAEVLTPTLSALVAEARPQDEVIVVDNASTDNSAAIAAGFPGVRVLRMAENKRLMALNEAAGTTKNELVCLLNNDFIIKQGFIKSALRNFGDPNVFGAVAKILSADGTKIDTTACVPRMDAVFFKYDIVGRGEPDGPAFTERKYTVSAAIAGVYRKRMLVELGGFDDLYLPAYWEEIDVGYNAWKRGWTLIHDPGMQVLHNHKNIMINALGQYGALKSSNRNKHLFAVKNFSSWLMMARYIVGLPFVLAAGTIKQGWVFMDGFLAVFPRLGTALARRRSSNRGRTRSDEEIFRLIRKGSPPAV